MLVYGDAERIETIGAKKAALLEALERLARLPPGLKRHEALVMAFIGASELAQGVADAEAEARGCEAPSEAQRGCMDILVALARAVDESWRNDFRGAMAGPKEIVLRGFADDDSIRTKRAEGYAFYALYPESYLEAARRSGLGPRTCVIGIRSIGIGLAALVAAALGAAAPFSLRPVGHPFRREIRAGRELSAEIARDSGRPFAVVDEGPGLSGSSFGAVADWLEANGVAPDRIHFFPSHSGSLGPEASAAHRTRWEHAPRHFNGFDDLLLSEASGHRLEAWIADLVGPLDAPLLDISGGAWRPLRYDSEHAWPGANTQQERRKFIARSGGACWLVKFAGLGDDGVRKLRMARRLHEVGLGPEPAGLCHGFLVERWIEDGRSLDRTTLDPPDLVYQVGAYLACRAKSLRPPRGGATLPELRTMAVINIREALGEEAAHRAADRLADAADLQTRVHRVWTDNRLHRHEWLVLEGGRLMKTDALDHGIAHDLVGCQDLAWDVAGAVIEFGLTTDEARALCARLKAEGCSVDADVLDFLIPCYLAFQLGVCTMAAQAAGADDTHRLRNAAEGYRRQLALLLTARIPSRV
jgi:hypothetical protein